MAIIKTFDSAARRIITPDNGAYGLALTTNNILYALDKKTLREITFIQGTSINDRKLVDIDTSTGMSFSDDAEIAFIESYENLAVIGVRKNSSAYIIAYFVDSVTLSVSHTVELLISTFDRINKQDGVFTMITGNEARIFGVSWNYVRILSDVESCTATSEEIYFTTPGITDKLCRDALINVAIGPTISSYFEPPVIILNEEEIRRIVITPDSKIVLASDTNYKVYNHSGLSYVNSIANDTVFDNRLNLRTDMHGHMFYNSQTAHIFDTKYVDTISYDSLGNVQFIDLQQSRHIQTNNNYVAIQTSNEILVLEKITPSYQTRTVSVSDAPLTTTSKGIDHGRLIEFILPIGSHSIAIECDDDSSWQENFDLSFFIDAGFDRRLDALTDDSTINCRLNLLINEVPTEVVVNLSTSIIAKDILSSKYNMLDYRINGMQNTTLRQFIADKNVKFDISRNNINFEIVVNQSIRTARASALHLHLLKIFRYAHTSKLIITTM